MRATWYGVGYFGHPVGQNGWIFGAAALIQRQEPETEGANNPRGANQALLRDVGVTVKKQPWLASCDEIRESDKADMDISRLSVVDCARR